MARFNANGTLDTTFSVGGWLTDAFDKQTRVEFPTAVAVQGDGKIVVYLAATGDLDTAFGLDGKAWVEFGL